MLATASKGLVIAFNTKITAGAQRLAETEGVDIRSYNVIYDIINDVEKALKGLLTPEEIEVVEGHAEVRAVFSAGKRGKIAGIYITDGKAVRSAEVRVKRGDQVLVESSIASLRRFKDDVREVATGYECGVGIKDYEEFKEGDTLEFFRKEKAD
jgi:translation initiation factor IF-2